jgi:glycosyltransferase involved in cell wall biosynthesis
MVKKIAVFAPMGTLDTQTGILNAAECFAASGYAVDVFTVRNKLYPEPQFSHENITVKFFPFSYSAQRESRSLVTLFFTAWMILTSVLHRHTAIFAGGVRGLISAYFYSFFRPIPIVNYQTELYIENKLDTKGATLFKAIERRAAQKSLITIEHDEQRSELLCEDLQIDRSKVVIVPNAPFGPAVLSSSHYLYNSLGIDRQYKLLLNPGTLSEFFDSSRAVQISQGLGLDWLCVVHSAQPRTLDDPYIEKLVSLNQREKVLFSLAPTPYSEINELLGSARIGLVLYSSQMGKNTASVGLASGKLSHFLKLGIPVIVSDLPGLADFVRQHQVGEVLTDDDLPSLIDKIDRNIDDYRKRCIKCFDEHLAYEVSFAKVIKLID